jgi:biotin carboxyl carrier protein
MSPRRTRPGDRTDGRTATGAPVAAPPPGTTPVAPPPARIVDPRAVRVALGPSAAHADAAPIVFEPAAVPLAPAPRITGSGVLGGVAAPPVGFRAGALGDAGVVIIDGEATHVRFDRFGPVHGAVIEGLAEATRTPVILLPLDGPGGPAGSAGSGGAATGSMSTRQGIERREVVVDGWRIEVEIESERRASLRERARRGREETAHGGPTEVHAIIPGVVVSVSVVPGDAVVAGQQLLVVEAMKMQNELRAPRDGVISRVAVGAGVTIEVGDLLLVLE